MNWRFKKRFTTILVIILIILLFNLYRYIKTRPAPSCFDGIQNQGELGVDCGGPCPPCRLFELKEIKVVEIKKFVIRNVLDVLVVLLNQNPDYGLNRLKVKLMVKKDDIVLWQAEKIIYINPGQKKYIFFENLPLSYEKFDFEVELEKNFSWQKPLILPSRIDFEFSNVSLKDEEKFIILEGEAFNKRNLNLNNINLIGFLQDEYGSIESFSYTSLGSFKGFENKKFKLIFFKPKIKISNYKLIIDTNLFEQNVINP